MKTLHVFLSAPYMLPNCPIHSIPYITSVVVSVGLSCIGNELLKMPQNLLDRDDDESCSNGRYSTFVRNIYVIKNSRAAAQSVTYNVDEFNVQDENNKNESDGEEFVDSNKTKHDGDEEQQEEHQSDSESSEASLKLDGNDSDESEQKLILN